MRLGLGRFPAVRSVLPSTMQIMDQRIIGTTAIRCVGNTLLLQGRVYSPPYVIAATGPVKRMRASLRRDPSVAAYRDWGRVVGLGYEVSTLARAVIPTYSGPITMTYATPTQ
jgi:uncharacterized protein YlxW (UPF0749 family)